MPELERSVAAAQFAARYAATLDALEGRGAAAAASGDPNAPPVTTCPELCRLRCERSTPPRRQASRPTGEQHTGWAWSSQPLVHRCIAAQPQRALMLHLAAGRRRCGRRGLRTSSSPSRPWRTSERWRCWRVSVRCGLAAPAFSLPLICARQSLLQRRAPCLGSTACSRSCSHNIHSIQHSHAGG